SLSITSMTRSCDDSNLWYAAIGFIDNANGQQMIVEFTLPDGSTWDTEAFTPNSDHYAVDNQQIRNSVPSTEGSPPWPVGVGVTYYAVFRPSNGTWYVRGAGAAIQWGKAGDIPVPGYYGTPDITLAVFRPSTGTWYLRYTEGPHGSVVWGKNGDRPALGDY